MNSKKEKGGPKNYVKRTGIGRHTIDEDKQRQYNNTFVNGIVLGIFLIWVFSMGLQISRDFQSGDFQSGDFHLQSE